eukprot:scaffold9343_cov189-Ochromonas_danica.AAC.5
MTSTLTEEEEFGTSSSPQQRQTDRQTDRDNTVSIKIVDYTTLFFYLATMASSSLSLSLVWLLLLLLLLMACHFSFTAALSSSHPSTNLPILHHQHQHHHHSQPNICIVQNGGGGHGALGYYLGQEVLAGGGRLTILQDKCDYSQQPFSSYRNDFQLLPQQLQDTPPPPPPPPDTSSVVRVLSWSDVKTASREKLVSLGLGQIDYLVDNWSKKVEDAQTVLELARQLQVSQLVFISSAGMYQEGNYHPAGHSQGQGHYSMPLLREEDVVHEENASRKVEQEVIASGLPYTILRLQYLYGELSNKRYLDYFWRFLEQGEDIVWPGSGDQLVALTHQRDVARCILQVLGHAGAVKEIFNCGTDRYVSYATLASMAKEAWKHCGKSTKMGQAGSNGSGSSSGKVDDFPFRSTTFITSPHKVMARVGWRAHEDLWDGLLKEASSYPSSQ